MRLRRGKAAAIRFGDAVISIRSDSGGAIVLCNQEDPVSVLLPRFTLQALRRIQRFQADRLVPSHGVFRYSSRVQEDRTSLPIELGYLWLGVMDPLLLAINDQVVATYLL